MLRFTIPHKMSSDEDYIASSAMDDNKEDISASGSVMLATLEAAKTMPSFLNYPGIPQ